MSRRIPMAPMTVPSASRRAEAFRVVGMTSPAALRGFSRTLRVTPRSTTSRSAAMNSRVSSAEMMRDKDCSITSSGRNPRSSKTASLAWRIFPRRSLTKTGSGAFLIRLSAYARALSSSRMSRRIPMRPLAWPAPSRSADAFNVVGMTSPDALPGWSRRFRVTPRSTTSRTAATNSWVSGGLRKRETDCSRTSSRRRPSNCETAAFASRILPRRSQTKTGSGAFATMTSAARVLRTLSSRVESRPRLARTTAENVIHSLFPLLALPLPTKARQRSDGCPGSVAQALRRRWGPARPRKKVRDWPAHSGYLPAPTMDGRFILVEGARQNNLKTVGVRVPVGAVTAVTGVAGAGKSSLAFDVLHAEGYRRYVETFSPYARQFLERIDRPAAARIDGVLPSLAIDRTAPVRTSRSTVGTMTSIADYLRALWARAAVLHCKSCGQVVVRDSPSSIFNALITAALGKQVLLCFPCRVGRVSAKALRETL